MQISQWYFIWILSRLRLPIIWLLSTSNGAKGLCSGLDVLCYEVVEHEGMFDLNISRVHVIWESTVFKQLRCSNKIYSNKEKTSFLLFVLMGARELNIFSKGKVKYFITYYTDVKVVFVSCEKRMVSFHNVVTFRISYSSIWQNSNVYNLRTKSVPPKYFFTALNTRIIRLAKHLHTSSLYLTVKCVLICVSIQISRSRHNKHISCTYWWMRNGNGKKIFYVCWY